MRKRAVVFILSDFLDAGYEKPLRIAARKHDVVAVVVSDPREGALPPVGLVELEDAETGAVIVVDTLDRKAVAAFAAQAAARARRRIEALNAIEVDTIPISTASPYDRPLQRFFERRARRLR